MSARPGHDGVPHGADVGLAVCELLRLSLEPGSTGERVRTMLETLVVALSEPRGAELWARDEGEVWSLLGRVGPEWPAPVWVSRVPRSAWIEPIAGRRAERYVIPLLHGDFCLGALALCGSPGSGAGWSLNRVSRCGPPFASLLALRFWRDSALTNAQQIRAFLDSTADAVVVVDHSGLIQAFNPAAEAMFGWESSEVIGREIGMLMGSAYMADVDTQLRARDRTRVRGVLGAIGHASARRRDGMVFPTRVSTSEVVGRDGLRYIVVVRDISAEMARHAELDAARLHAEEALSAKSRFLSVMGHELKTPLNGMMGMAQLLSLSRGADPEVGASVDAILDCGRRLDRLVGDLLEFAAGDVLVGEPGQADIGPGIEEVIATVRRSAERKGLDLVYSPANAPMIAALPHDAWVRVVGELVDNAVRFTAEGRVAIHVEADEREVRVRVSDTGPGIPDGVADRVFEAFSMGDDTHARHTGGTGLGLALCQQRVRRYGGQLSMEDSVERGARFLVRLPRVDG